MLTCDPSSRIRWEGPAGVTQFWRLGGRVAAYMAGGFGCVGRFLKDETIFKRLSIFITFPFGWGTNFPAVFTSPSPFSILFLFPFVYLSLFKTSSASFSSLYLPISILYFSITSCSSFSPQSSSNIFHLYYGIYYKRQCKDQSLIVYPFIFSLMTFLEKMVHTLYWLNYCK